MNSFQQNWRLSCRLRCSSFRHCSKRRFFGVFLFRETPWSVVGGGVFWLSRGVQCSSSCGTRSMRSRSIARLYRFSWIPHSYVLSRRLASPVVTVILSRSPSGCRSSFTGRRLACGSFFWVAEASSWSYSRRTHSIMNETVHCLFSVFFNDPGLPSSPRDSACLQGSRPVPARQFA